MRNENTVIKHEKERPSINIYGNMVVDEKYEELRSNRDHLKAHVHSYENVTYWKDEDADIIVDDLLRCNQTIAWCEREMEHRKEELVSVVEACTTRCLKARKTSDVAESRMCLI